MKRLIFLVAFVALSYTGFAQGNLQFSQVLNLEYPVSGDISTTLQVGNLIVPSGKVWKIESVSATRPQAGVTWGVYVLLDNVLIYNGGNPSFGSSLPYWFKEGTHKLKVYGGNQFTVTEAYVSFSIIEYNIIP